MSGSHCDRTRWTRVLSCLAVSLLVTGCSDGPTTPGTESSASFVESASLEAASLSGAVVLLIDEESIGKDNEPNSFSDSDVNEGEAGIGVRGQLPYFAANVENQITLYTGEVEDEGWFVLKTIPSSWDEAGPTGEVELGVGVSLLGG